jgi:arsenate reductase
MACRVASPLSLRFARPLSSRAAASSITLWHNPNCSKSRAALAFLESRGEPFQTRQYLEQKPTMSEMRELQAALRLSPIEWARTTEPEWIDRFDNATIYDDLLPDNDDILRAMVEFPIIIERPILVCGDRAIVGRPKPERILTLLDATTAAGGSAPAPSTSAAAAHAMEALATATESALGRGVPSEAVAAKLLSAAAELDSLQP